MTKTVGQWARQASQFPQALRDAEKRALRTAGFVAADSIRESAGARGWPTDRRRLPIRVRNRSDQTVTVAGLGFASMFEKGAEPHRVAPRARRRRGGRQVAVSTPQGPRAYANHPGFQGRPFWNAGVARAAPDVARVFRRELDRAITRTFRG